MNEFGPVQLDLLTASLRISGTTQEIDPARRLSDVLNGPQSQITMTQVTLRDLSGRILDHCETLIVEKREVLVVVPRESVDQMAQHRARRFGIAPPTTRPVPVLVVAPPFLARGFISFREVKDASRGAAALNSFFPLLDASLTISGAPIERASVVLINRESVLAVGPRQVQPATVAIGPPSDKLSWTLRTPVVSRPPSPV